MCVAGLAARKIVYVAVTSAETVSADCHFWGGGFVEQVVDVSRLAAGRGVRSLKRKRRVVYSCLVKGRGRGP